MKHKLIVRDLLPIIPETPTLGSEIAKRLDRWCKTSVKSALNEMTDLGLIARVTLTDQHGYQRHLYSKVPS